MAASNIDRAATDSADTSIDYTASEYCNILDNFFSFEMHQMHPQIPFYDTPRCTLFSGSCHKKVQIKRKILEDRAKY